MRLDRWFRLHFPSLPHSRLSRLMRKGQVRLDGKRVKSGARVAAGQSVRVPPLDVNRDGGRGAGQGAPRPVAPLSAQDRALFDAMILHEDKDLIILNKPSGLAVQGGTGTRRHIDGMLMALEAQTGQRARLVHRLDRDTSGVLVIARRRAVAASLGKLFSGRAVRKIYWALVAGVPRPAQGKVDQALVKTMGPEGERVRAASPDQPGQKAVTHYAVIDKAPPAVSWLSLKPVTGRQHQLRAHMALTGLPILGDGKYGGLEHVPGGLPRRLHLHARRISFAHPRGGILDITAPLPDDLLASWQFFGFDPARFDGDEK